MKYTKTKAVLNQLVADLSQMSMIIHQTHWYMRGPNFLKLHPLMDEFMEEIDSQLDVISERLIALDGSPYSTLTLRFKTGLVNGTKQPQNASHT